MKETKHLRLSNQKSPHHQGNNTRLSVIFTRTSTGKYDAVNTPLSTHTHLLPWKPHLHTTLAWNTPHTTQTHWSTHHRQLTTNVPWLLLLVNLLNSAYTLFYMEFFNCMNIQTKLRLICSGRVQCSSSHVYCTKCVPRVLYKSLVTFTCIHSTPLYQIWLFSIGLCMRVQKYFYG